jgi:hypothetical protein
MIAEPIVHEGAFPHSLDVLAGNCTMKVIPPQVMPEVEIIQKGGRATSDLEKYNTGGAPLLTLLEKWLAELLAL